MIGIWILLSLNTVLTTIALLRLFKVKIRPQGQMEAAELIRDFRTNGYSVLRLEPDDLILRSKR